MLNAVRNMPPLPHALQGEEFNIKKSEVVKWLLAQPGVMNFVFNKMSVYKIIKYNQATGKWQGVDYED